LYLLRRCGFGEKWCNWIALYFFSVLSVMVNGPPSSFFISSHGRRQGDHLSSLLFVIIIEALSKMISATVDGGLLSSFFLGSRNFDKAHSSLGIVFGRLRLP
jgi:hypothetical protein